MAVDSCEEFHFSGFVLGFGTAISCREIFLKLHKPASVPRDVAWKSGSLKIPVCSSSLYLVLLIFFLSVPWSYWSFLYIDIFSSNKHWPCYTEVTNSWTSCWWIFNSEPCIDHAFYFSIMNQHPSWMCNDKDENQVWRWFKLTKQRPLPLLL